MLVGLPRLRHDARNDNFSGGAGALASKVRRYILVPLLLMGFMAFWSLITGRTPDLSLVLFVLIVSWTSTYFGNRDPIDGDIDFDAPPTRNEMIRAVACAPLGLLGLGVFIYELVTGLDRGIIEISSARDWTVSWAGHPFGFVFTIAMYLAFTALMLAMLYYSWFTIREWIDERRVATDRR